MVHLNKLDSALFDEISDLLEKPNSMSQKTAAVVQMRLLAALWNSQNELIDHIREQNGRVTKNEAAIKELKENNILKWVKENKTKSFLIFLGFMSVNSLVNWQGLRRPVIHAALKTIGIDIPLEAIP